MTKQYDFKGALASINESWASYCRQQSVEVPEHIKASILALRIADKLQSGEVSDKMVYEGAFGLEKGIGSKRYRQCFKAMAQQLMKECEND